MRGIGILLLAATAAHAQPAPEPQPAPAEAPPTEAPEPSPATIAFQEGRALLEAGKYQEACDKFDASIKDDPDATGTLLNLGLCNEKIGKTATALVWFRKAQFRAAETKMADYELAAKQHTTALAQKVPTLKIVAPTTPVTLDGVVLRDVDLGLVEVDAGKHVIEAGNERREIVILDGQKQTIDLNPPKKVFVTIDRGVTRRRYAYIAAGVGVGFYAASLTLSLVGKSKYESTDHPEQYVNWQHTVRYGGTSLFVVGTAAIGTAVYLYLGAPKPERVEQVAPLVGPNQLGVAVAGSF